MVVALGGRHGLIAQAVLRASVVVVVSVRRLLLLLLCVALVPASQMFCHDGFLEVLDGLLVAAGDLAIPGRAQSGVRVLRHAVHLVVPVVTVHFVAVISWLCWVVRRIDGVVSLHLVVVHVHSVSVRLWFWVAGITRHIVGRGGGSGSRLVGLAIVRLSQVGHATRVGVHVFSVAAASSAPVRVVAGDAVLHAGLAGVGGAVVEDLGAVAASGGGEAEGRHGGLGLRQLRLGLQAATALAEMLWNVL